MRYSIPSTPGTHMSVQGSPPFYLSPGKERFPRPVAHLCTSNTCLLGFAGHGTDHPCVVPEAQRGVPVDNAAMGSQATLGLWRTVGGRSQLRKLLVRPSVSGPFPHSCLQHL